MHILELVLDKSSVVKRFSFQKGSYLYYYLSSIDSPIFLLKLTIFIFLIFFLFLYTTYSQKRKKINYIILLLLFLCVSFAIRSPHIDRPLSGGNEWVTAKSMVALENLAVQGALPHKFCIIQTYPQPTNKHIKNGTYINERGDSYYMSFPPFSIILPFLLFKLLSLTPSVKILQIFNMTLHGIATIFIFLTIRLVMPKSNYRDFYAVFGSIIFIFTAPNLWYFSNVYSWDIFWHYIWVIAIYVFILLLQNLKEGYSSNGLLFLLGVLTFFLIYSDYHGILFAISIISIMLIYRNPLLKKIILVITLSSLLALILIIFQYSLIAGPENFLKVMLDRGYDRSFLILPTILSEYEFKNIIIYYLASFYLPIALFLLLIVRILKGKFTDIFNLSESEIILLYLSLFPVIVHHLFLMKWTTEHFYSILKTSVFFSFLSAIMLSRIFSEIINKKVYLLITIFVTLSVLVCSIISYEAIFARGTEFKIYENAGQVIKEHVNDSEVVFASSNIYIYPQLVFYSKRNIQSVDNVQEAQDWLRRYDRKCGTIFYFDDKIKFIKYEKVTSDGQHDWKN